MASRPRTFTRLAGALAFAATVIAGIAFGCFFSAAETIEDRLKARHPSPVSHHVRR